MKLKKLDYTIRKHLVKLQTRKYPTRVSSLMYNLLLQKSIVESVYSCGIILAVLQMKSTELVFCGSFIYAPFRMPNKPH